MNRIQSTVRTVCLKYSPAEGILSSVQYQTHILFFYFFGYTHHSRYRLQLKTSEMREVLDVTLYAVHKDVAEGFVLSAVMCFLTETVCTKMSAAHDCCFRTNIHSNSLLGPHNLTNDLLVLSRQTSILPNITKCYSVFVCSFFTLQWSNVMV